MDKLLELKGKANSYWGERITSQMMFLGKLLQYNPQNRLEELLKKTVDALYAQYKIDGVLRDKACKEAESFLSEASDFTKGFHVICAAHAHIDMNWMWAYDETVGITLDTFRTMLDFMKEYPEFTFSQSQASVYKIVEEYRPDMLREIKQRVKEGRWEITATTWVETDKNMTNGESLSRHILYTKKYISELFGIDKSEMKIDFEPDTFGHNINIPEILTKGGIPYYYHCRGDASGSYLQNWQSPSGSSVLVHIEPAWYNSELNPEMVMYMPEFWSRTGMNTILRVYGVGNHGGGATRRDIEKCIDMASWPVFPKIKFGTMLEYFEIVNQYRDSFPTVTFEKNAIFSGCYTSQSRIKMANRVSEDRLFDAEALSSVATAFEGIPYNSPGFEKAWQKTLFNHFHDILPGSCVIGTREYAMSKFQETMALANSEQSKAMRSIADKIDTQSLVTECCDLMNSNSEGAGVGFGVSSYRPSQPERGKGLNRVLHVFNPLPFERRELCEVTLWDWPGETSELYIEDSEKNPLPFQIVSTGRTRNGTSTYWGHKYIILLVYVTVPATGYTTLVITKRTPTAFSSALNLYDRVHTYPVPVLENEKIHAVFGDDMSVISLVDKKTGEELINLPGCMFRRITEDTDRGMTSWTVGRYREIRDFKGCVRNVKINNGEGLLRKSISYELVFDHSRASVTVYLDRNSDRLNFVLDCEWLEVGKPETGIPQLNFHVPVNYGCKEYKYGIAFGSIDRTDNKDDRPGIGYAMAKRQTGSKVAVHAKTKYGFVCNDDSVSVDLIRSSYDPDPHPELYNHHIELAVQVIPEELAVPEKESLVYRHPLCFVSGVIQKGAKGPVDSYLSLEGDDVHCSGLKLSEDGEGLIVRLYNTSSTPQQARLQLKSSAKDAFVVNLDEEKTDGAVSLHENAITAVINAFSVKCIKVIL
ncbi:MAG TPA: alpha-mannosidase [Clostridiales bacterium]|nr:alpha-mannosidase [Clostridiales bacterium]